MINKQLYYYIIIIISILHSPTFHSPFFLFSTNLDLILMNRFILRYTNLFTTFNCIIIINIIIIVSIFYNDSHPFPFFSFLPFSFHHFLSHLFLPFTPSPNENFFIVRFSTSFLSLFSLHNDVHYIIHPISHVSLSPLIPLFKLLLQISNKGDFIYTRISSLYLSHFNSHTVGNK